ncbi:autoinducer binding domain-containing protein [Komagataeibacter medellinensis]|uniref:autoinducer binding domain-containing protein n=1 Tax=Komagataeibacter medellinensis TaxID=1177712 RepID=UPI00130525EF|nr:autoinducer binding domain-containing protein [Komagataeibacter medellinensis]
MTQHYHHIDPVIDPVRHGLCLHPYDWKDARITTPQQQTLLHEFGEMGSGAATPCPSRSRPEQ